MFDANGNVNGNGLNNGAAYGAGYGYQAPYGTMPGMGGWNYQPAQPAQRPKQYSTLSPEEIKTLMDKGPEFSLQLTKEEKLRAVCNHRTADGMSDTLEEDQDGYVYCKVCGYRFIPVNVTDLSIEEVQASVDRLVDILQTIKMIYLDFEPNSEREYMQIIPMMEKIPKLYQMAIANYQKHEQNNPYHYDTRNMGTAKMFETISAMLNGGQAAAYNQQMNQAPYAQQPYAVPMAPQTNGFGYGNPAIQQPMYQPQGYQAQPGFQYVPNQQVPMQTAPTQEINVQPAQTAAPKKEETATVKG